MTRAVRVYEKHKEVMYMKMFRYLVTSFKEGYVFAVESYKVVEKPKTYAITPGSGKIEYISNDEAKYRCLGYYPLRVSKERTLGITTRNWGEFTRLTLKDTPKSRESFLTSVTDILEGDVNVLEEKVSKAKDTFDSYRKFLSSAIPRGALDA